MDTITNMDELGAGVLSLEPVELEETTEEISGDLGDPANSIDHAAEDDELTIREDELGDGRVSVTVIQNAERGLR